MMTNGSIYFEMNNTRPTDNTTNNETGLYINNNTIYIETKIDRSSYTGFVILEYIKTTDQEVDYENKKEKHNNTD